MAGTVVHPPSAKATQPAASHCLATRSRLGRRPGRRASSMSRPGSRDSRRAGRARAAPTLELRDRVRPAARRSPRRCRRDRPWLRCRCRGSIARSKSAVGDLEVEGAESVGEREADQTQSALDLYRCRPRIAPERGELGRVDEAQGVASAGVERFDQFPRQSHQGRILPGLRPTRAPRRRVRRECVPTGEPPLGTKHPRFAGHLHPGGDTSWLPGPPALPR